MSFKFNNLTSYAACCEQIRFYYHLKADTEFEMASPYHNLIATVHYQKAPYTSLLSFPKVTPSHTLSPLASKLLSYSGGLLFLFGRAPSPRSYKERSSINICRVKEWMKCQHFEQCGKLFSSKRISRKILEGVLTINIKEDHLVAPIIFYFWIFLGDWRTKSGSDCLLGKRQITRRPCTSGPDCDLS